MNVGRLDISTNQAILTFSSRYARLDMRQPQPQLSITRQRGGISIDAQPPQLEVDSSACRAEEGDKTTTQLLADYAQQGMQDVSAAASQATQRGLYILKNFHNSKHIMADIAHNKALPQPSQMELKFIPSRPPQIGFTENVFHMDVQPDSIKLDWEVSLQPDIQVVQTGGVDIRMAQYPSIAFNYTPPQALDISA